MGEHGASEKAIEAGAGELVRGGVAIIRHIGDPSRESDWTPTEASHAILAAAHDPALGLDRSVCLRDVAEWLANEGPLAVRDLIRDFTLHRTERERTVTDRHSAYIVVLDRDVREDDAEPIISALRMVKGVSEVEPVIGDAAEQIARMRVDSEWRTALVDFLRDRPHA